MGSVSGAKGITDEHLGESGQLLDELRIVGLLARMESDVLEQADTTPLEILDQAACRIPDTVVGKGDGLAELLSERASDRCETELGATLPLRSAAM